MVAWRKSRWHPEKSRARSNCLTEGSTLRCEEPISAPRIFYSQVCDRPAVFARIASSLIHADCRGHRLAGECPRPQRMGRVVPLAGFRRQLVPGRCRAVHRRSAGRRDPSTGSRSTSVRDRRAPAALEKRRPRLGDRGGCDDARRRVRGCFRRGRQRCARIERHAYFLHRRWSRLAGRACARWRCACARLRAQFHGKSCLPGRCPRPVSERRSRALMVACGRRSAARDGRQHDRGDAGSAGKRLRSDRWQGLGERRRRAHLADAHHRPACRAG